MARALKVISALVGVASAVDLTPETWEEQTSGKTVFVKFLAPW